MQGLSRRVFGFALACALVACAGGCRTVSKWFEKQGGPDPEAAARYWDGPRVGPGMQLQVQVGSATIQPKLMTVLVDQNGDIILPYLLQKSVHCDKMSLEELKQKLVGEYSTFIRQPQITVTFGEHDGQGVSPWGTVTVMGEVGTQGPVNMPPTMDLTVTKVLQLAGGLKPFADKTRIRVTRCGKDGRKTQTVVDLREIGEDGSAEKDMLLKAGDVVYVPETWY